MAGTHARSARLATGVLIVGDDADLLGQLHDYLTRAGVEARATRRLDEAWRRGSAEAIVLFPDDFDTGEVTDGLRLLLARSRCPRVIVIECVVAAVFVVLASVSVTATAWVLVAGYVGHGVKDFWQERHHFVVNTRWWPPFCACVDWVVALVLIGVIAAGVNFLT